jgi:hypothetical protein
VRDRRVDVGVVNCVVLHLTSWCPSRASLRASRGDVPTGTVTPLPDRQKRWGLVSSRARPSGRWRLAATRVGARRHCGPRSGGQTFRRRRRPTVVDSQPPPWIVISIRHRKPVTIPSSSSVRTLTAYYSATAPTCSGGPPRCTLPTCDYSTVCPWVPRAGYSTCGPAFRGNRAAHACGLSPSGAVAAQEALASRLH